MCTCLCNIEATYYFKAIRGVVWVTSHKMKLINSKQPLSNFQPHFGKSAKQPQAEMKNGVAYKKNVYTFFL